MRAVLVSVVLSCLGVALGCQSSKEPRVASALAGLPEYTPEEATLFDDILSESVFGSKAPPPSKDANFGARVAHADWIGRARVSTVSKEALAGKDGFTLALSPESPALSGETVDTSVELRVARGSPAFTRLDTAPEALVGKRVILFMRRYADRGEAANHWHCEPDDPVVAAAVEHQKGLDAQARKQETKD